MTDYCERLTPLSRRWFEHLLRMIDLEASGIPGLTVEQAMAELDPHLPRIAAALNASPVVTVKELEWEEDGLNCWSAQTSFGAPYVIRRWGNGQDDYGWWPAFDEGAQAADAHSFEAAQAACRADFARRISECTTLTTREEVEREVIEGLIDLADHDNDAAIKGAREAAIWLRSQN